jgi:DNA replication and repair protein RecF
MHLQDLKLTNFKNYESGTFRFSPRLNLIAGLNGMGKTNVLDAVYYLCMGKSHFGTNDRHVVRHGEEFFRLEGKFLMGKKKEKIVAKVVPGKQKVIERNDDPYARIADHVGFLPVVFLAPDDTALAMEGSEERRRFIDNTLCQLDARYLNHLVAYNKILLNRNAALKQFVEKNTFNSTLISTYDRQLLEPAGYIFEKRTWFAGEFRPVFSERYRNICGGYETVDCQYRSQLASEDLTALLETSLEKDRILQRTTVGIHKDDLLFFMDDLPLKRFASQGQLKSFVLALKLGQYECLKKEKGTLPLLLLDDLFDKLDDQRVSQLIALLVKQDFGQVFITDTHPERAEDIAKKFGNDYKKFFIASGTVTF